DRVRGPDEAEGTRAMLALLVTDPQLGDVLRLLALRGDRRDDVIAGKAERHRRAREIMDVEIGERSGDNRARAIDDGMMDEREVRARGQRRKRLGVGLRRLE